ncbi:cytidine deaminase-like protein [Fomitopsis serialis]|uniref:cytidine deaminase-like protein n=1 Tax=Fomitopsis serialis TaxID=139415 RepID=UPI002007FD2F|nr:cytidine deaminase-like protein [Neoantrodia serialis]KAH9930200.1 cytidine deaminase-like protein [Neoantrodia serialis]
MSVTAKTWTLGVPDRERLIKAASEAKEFAYCKYSNFRVGAALLAADGSIIKGANIENASYGGTICAERTAIVKAVSEGTRAFVALARRPFCHFAMRICRQVLREFCALTMPVLLVPSNYEKLVAEGKADGGVLETSIEELLPHSFGPEHLELPRQS